MLATRWAEIEAVTRYSNYYVGRCFTWLSTPLTVLASAIRVHPNVVTLVSLGFGLAGALTFWLGGRTELIAGAMLIYLSYVLDWTDGQLARYTGKVSPFGGWLDQVCDRVKEAAYLAGLGFGVLRQNGDTAAVALAFFDLFILYLLEYYSQMHRGIPTPDHPGAQGAALASSQPAVGARAHTFVIDFSIDEQYLFVSIATVLAGAKTTLMGIAMAGLVMAIYKPAKGWRSYYRSQRRGQA